MASDRKKTDAHRTQLGKVLNDIVEAEGGALLVSILRDRASQSRQLPAGPAERKAGIESAKDRGTHFLTRRLPAAATKHLRSGLSSAQEGLRSVTTLPARWKSQVRKAEENYRPRSALAANLLAALDTASFASGYLIGLRIPRWDLRLMKQGSPSQRIVLHGAPLLSAEISLEWTRAIVARAQLRAGLNATQKQALERLSWVLSQTSGGMSAGVRASQSKTGKKLSRRDKEVDVPLNDKTYRLAETLFASLSDLVAGTGKGKKP